MAQLQSEYYSAVMLTWMSLFWSLNPAGKQICPSVLEWASSINQNCVVHYPTFFDTQPYFKQEPDLWAWNPFITGSERSFLQVCRDPVRLLLQLMSPKTQDCIKVGLEGNSKWEAEEGKTENVRVEQWKKNTYIKKEESNGQQQLLYFRVILTGLPARMTWIISQIIHRFHKSPADVTLRLYSGLICRMVNRC